MSIQVSLNGFSFCILDSSDKTIVFYKKISLEQAADPVKLLGKIEEEFRTEAALDVPVQELLLLFSNDLYSLVPQKLFKETDIADYLKFNAKILKTDFIAHDTIAPFEIVNIYIPYANIINYLFDNYGEFEYKHSISVLLKSLLELPPKQHVKAYLHDRNNAYDLIIIENGELLLCNTFSYTTKEDFIYYLLFTAEQLNLNPEVFELILLGEITHESEKYGILYKYIKNITFMAPFHDFNFSDGMRPKRELDEYLLLNSF